MSETSIRSVTVEHVTIRSARDFGTVRQALEAALPLLDHGYAALVQAGRAQEALRLLESGAPLSIFGRRDHGALLRIAGLERRAIQYDIGNPLTASRMTRHALSAALYAPIRVLLREGEEGVAFEYDRPASTFGQFGSDAVDAVARELDERLSESLKAAAG
ncbi:DUF302 domain-containing protein [Methylobacterium organophilum]|uniref:DUF302 domain-containing protein n=1 Tax=Methylobacterium organophilum TaxID=410 RepID=A0ABQ4T7K6_METOR|nr:DUF302 domain-containing protein [Methylobacterium organophilum]GJE27631.1 hypothetical protein LKMONMHP_2491 [Methylobacterium organophilum]